MLERRANAVDKQRKISLIITHKKNLRQTKTRSSFDFFIHDKKKSRCLSIMRFQFMRWNNLNWVTFVEKLEDLWGIKWLGSTCVREWKKCEKSKGRKLTTNQEKISENLSNNPKSLRHKTFIAFYQPTWVNIQQFSTFSLSSTFQSQFTWLDVIKSCLEL